MLGGAGFYFFTNSNQKVSNQENTISPIAKSGKKSIFGGFGDNNEEKEAVPQSELAQNDILNILLLGIDRRSKAELGFRTDIMLLLSVNKSNNKVVMTSVPRDLWYDGGRINAVYNAGGWEEMQKAFEQITGQRPERFILTDFEDFSWIVDEMGGVPVTVETTFTDSLYPVDETFEYQTISFTQGTEKLTGERALIYARSRKGDNDNGDWGRMRRQHNILKGMLTAVTQPQSFLCKAPTNTNNQEGECAVSVDSNTLENALKFATTNRMDTNMNVMDLEYLWDFYKERNSYEIESLIMDYEYVYSPPQEEYGGAWVLVPIGKDYEAFHQKLKNKILNIPEEPAQNVEEPEVSQAGEL